MSTSATIKQAEDEKGSLPSRLISYIGSRQVLFAALFIFVVSFLPYLHTLKWGFVSDDPMIARYYDAATPLWEPFTHGYLKRGLWGLHSDYYRPLSAITFILDNRIWNWDPFGYRLTNLLIHGVVSMFVFLVSKNWLKSTKAALIAGLIFCFHPAHNEAAAWPSSRCDLLVPFFLLPAYLLYGSSKQYMSKLAGVPVLYAFALLSKESAMVFIPLLMLDNWMMRRKPDLRSFCRTYLPLLLVTGMYLLARRAATGMISPAKLHPEQIPDRLMDLPANLLSYLGMITWPHVPYPFTQKAHISPEYALLWFLGTLFSIYLLYRVSRISRIMFFLAVWVVLPLAMVSDFLPLMSRWLCPRFTYFSTVGLTAIYGGAGAHMIERIGGWKKGIAVGLVAVVVGSFAWHTVKSPPTWRSNQDMINTMRNVVTRH